MRMKAEVRTKVLRAREHQRLTANHQTLECGLAACRAPSPPICSYCPHSLRGPDQAPGVTLAASLLTPPASPEHPAKMNGPSWPCCSRSTNPRCPTHCCSHCHGSPGGTMSLVSTSTWVSLCCLSRRVGSPTPATPIRTTPETRHLEGITCEQTTGSNWGPDRVRV